MSEDIRTVGAISCKIIALLIFMFLDMTLGALMLFSDNTEKMMSKSRKEMNPNHDEELVMILGTFVFPGVQFALQLCLFFWYFSLIWKTFMFRYTLMGKLRETFYWAINIAVLNGVLFLAATGLRIVSILLCITSCLKF